MVDQLSAINSLQLIPFKKLDFLFFLSSIAVAIGNGQLV